MKILPHLFLLFLGFTMLTACQESAAPEAFLLAETTGTVIPPLPELDTDVIALGKMVYDQQCAACHGVELEGQPDWKLRNEDGSFKAPPHSADGHTWHHADSQLVEAVQLGGARFEGMSIGGTSPMPAYAEILSDDEITAVLTYIKSTWPKDIRQAQWEVTIMSSQQR